MLKRKDFKLSIPAIIKPPDSDHAESEDFSLSNILDTSKKSKPFNLSAGSVRRVAAIRDNAPITDQTSKSITRFEITGSPVKTILDASKSLKTGSRLIEHEEEKIQGLLED